MAKTKVEKFTVEQYAEAKEKAKELGINPVGKTKENLVDLVNEAIEATAKPAPKTKWYEETPLDVVKGDTIQIVSKKIEKAGVVKEILQDRYAKVLGPSPKNGLVRVVLLDEKTGVELNCPITIEVGKFSKVPEGWAFVSTTTEESNESEQKTA